MTQSAPKVKPAKKPEPRISPLRRQIPKPFRLITVTALAACALAGPGSSRALGQSKFGRVANQAWSGGVTVNNQMMPPSTIPRPPDPFEKKKKRTFPTTQADTVQLPSLPTIPRTAVINLKPGLDDTWREARARIIQETVKYLKEKNVGGGWRTSKNRLHLANSGVIFVGHDGSGFTIRFSLPGNTLNTWLRTPTPVSEHADPGFLVAFDLDVTINVDLRGNHLVAGPAQLNAKVQRPAGTNGTGMAAVAAADILKNYLGGPDFVGLLLGMVNNRQFAFDTGINKELAKLNPILALAAKGGGVQPGFDAASRNVTFTVVSAAPLPVIR